MKFLSEKWLGSAILLMAFSLPGAELLVNRDFSKAVNGVPTHWEYQKHKSKPQYKLNPATALEPANVEITTADKTSQGLLMFRYKKKLPAGSRITISGEYLTEDLTFGKNGCILISANGKYRGWPAKQPTYWLNRQLKPVTKWTKFKSTGRLRFPLDYLQLNSGLVNAKGTLKLRNLSLEVTEPTHTPDPKEEWVWREGEDIEKIKMLSNWSDGTKEYFSGKGGVFTEKGKIDWNFQIPEVTDPVTLFSKERTWYLWIRVYGYMDNPRIMIYRNDRYMTHLDTPANEKVDRQGKYCGAGKYIWLLCGSFKTKGGLQQFSFRPNGRMMLDAVLLTTDGNYAPLKFEAKAMKQSPVQDITTAHMIKAEYAGEGVSDTIALPVSFRIGGKNKIIPNDKKPAVFHFSLPADIQVKGMTSHWAGETWNSPQRWGKKYLTWKKTGTRTVNGKNINDYEAYLYFLSGNQYMIFLQAEPSAFKVRKSSVCEYYLESNGEKQLKESLELKHIAIKPATPFRKIYIGPSYVPFGMLYTSYPDLFTNFRNSGLNYMGAWAEPWRSNTFETFRKKAADHNCMITVVVGQYTGIKKQHIATGIDGKQLLKGLSGHGIPVLTLAMTEKDAPIAETMERTRLCASTGVNVEFDDEMTNVLYDTIDYSPAVKKLFREWLAENRKGVSYVEPEQIVRDRKKNPAMYRHWVDFKCSRIAYWYSLYRKAFDEGVAIAKANGKYSAAMKPEMFTCVQGLIVGRDGKPCTAEEVKESGYLDYRLLGKYCDVIQMMSYTYGGVKESAMPGDKMELYNNYTGKNNTAPILLAGGYGTEIAPENKVMLKYQVWDCLMQKPQIIVFYAGATLFNAPTLAPVVDAIRIARPYEDFFVDGTKYTGMKSGSNRVRLKALQLGKKVLVYATNYDNLTGPQETITFPTAPKTVLDCISGKTLSVKAKGFAFDFKASRGKLFLVEL